tara:strand:+ start:2017 stop:3084 length:1068 start_codon:yes stop_codon:yes gene_type:complete
MNEFEINDVRSEKQFKGITFSKFKRTDAKKELLNSLKAGRIEQALHWSAEFICCGCFIDLWDIILNFVGKHIHLGNPKLPIYLEMRFNNFKELISTYNGVELDIRNNDKVRKIFAEIIIILCSSKKKHSIESIKIKKQEEFDMTTMAIKLKAPNVQYATDIFKKDDPKELFIAINEFAFHVSKDSRSSLDACYWLEWILEFENLCKKRKDVCICERRSFVMVDEKCVKEPIWMIWDVLFKSNAEKKSEISDKILKSIFELFCIRYTSGVKKKRKYLLYFAISLLTDTFDSTIDIIENKATVDNITKKINLIYKEIKKNEQRPATDYLFTGLEKSNREKTFEKLEALNKLNTVIRS